MNQPLSVADLLDELIGDASSDYNDGDNAGYYNSIFNSQTGILTVSYTPDEESEAPCGPASYRFVLMEPS